MRIFFLVLLVLLTFSCAGQKAATQPKPPKDLKEAISRLPFAVIDSAFSDDAVLCIQATPTMKFFEPTAPDYFCGETIGELRRRLKGTLSAN